jgi:hypothetical protein
VRFDDPREAYDAFVFEYLPKWESPMLMALGGRGVSLQANAPSTPDPEALEPGTA